jgi:hypothetical protein
MAHLYADDDGVWREDEGYPRLGMRWETIEAVAAYRMEEARGGHLVIELEALGGDSLVLVAFHTGFAAVLVAMGRSLTGFDPSGVDGLSPLDADNDPVVIWHRAALDPSMN